MKKAGQEKLLSGLKFEPHVSFCVSFYENGDVLENPKYAEKLRKTYKKP